MTASSSGRITGSHGGSETPCRYRSQRRWATPHCRLLRERPDPISAGIVGRDQTAGANQTRPRWLGGRDGWNPAFLETEIHTTVKRSGHAGSLPQSARRVVSALTRDATSECRRSDLSGGSTTGHSGPARRSTHLTHTLAREWEFSVCRPGAPVNLCSRTGQLPFQYVGGRVCAFPTMRALIATRNGKTRLFACEALSSIHDLCVDLSHVERRPQNHFASLLLVPRP